MIPENAIAALKRGNKVEAIRLARDGLGIDLATAREAVELYAAGKTLAPAAERPRGHGLMPPEAVEALRRGKKIEAIRILRRLHGTGLKDSKDAVEGYLNSHPALYEKFRKAAGIGRGFFWVAGAVVAVAVLFAFLIDSN